MGCNSTLDYLPSETWRKVLGAHSCIVTITASLQNLGVLFIFYRSARQQTSSQRIMISLIFADFLTGFILAPLFAVQYFDEKLLNNCIIESIRRYLVILLLGASTFSLSFISYDRCLHLIKLNRYIMRNKVLYSGIFLCWLIPILVPMLRFTGKAEKAYSLTVIMFGILILTTILVSYISVVLSLRKHSKQSVVRKNSIEKERKTAVTVVMIITLYILMIVPAYIQTGLKVSNILDKYSLSILYNITALLAVTNSSVNPIIYCYRTAEMRKHIRRLFRRFCPTTSNKVSSDNNEELQTERIRRMTRVSRVSESN